MENKYKGLFGIIAIAIITTSILALPAFSKNQNTNPQSWGPTLENQNIKNVIVMVPDGCSYSIQTAARWYNEGPLNLDEIVTGTVATWMADSIITDSASAATAFSTGHKTSNGFISVGPRDDTLLTGFEATAEPYVPIATVLEGAKLEGKATGLVATSRITHATPAAYGAHIESRNFENEIMEHLVYQDIDVVLGGGKRHLASSRTDGEDLQDVLIDRGYHFVETKLELDDINSGKVWGMFANSHMEADIDRSEFAPEQPSLAEMTQKAIDLLSQDKDGFFLMVEGSQVDWAGHANDPIYMITDFLAFDEAVGVALDFAKTDGKTLVIAFPDHNTGGLSIGSYYQNEESNDIQLPYTATTIEGLVENLQDMKITSTGLVRKLNDLGPSPTNIQIKDVFGDWWGLDITDADIAAMDLTDSNSISEYISKTYTVFGWTTDGHNGEDVPLWAYAPKDAVPAGHYDNTELAGIVAEALGFDLADVNDELFIDVEEAGFADNDIGTSGDELYLDFTDPTNPVLEITTEDHEYILPVYKDILIIDGNSEDPVYLNGVVVYASLADSLTGTVFIPQQAVELIV
jgi:alkaline phosphatase